MPTRRRLNAYREPLPSGPSNPTEQMYQRALQGYENANGIDNATTYVPALKTISNLGLVFERQANIAKSRTMYSKALFGYEKVFGPDHPRSQSLRDKLHALRNKMLLYLQCRPVVEAYYNYHSITGLEEPPPSYTANSVALLEDTVYYFKEGGVFYGGRDGSLPSCLSWNISTFLIDDNLGKIEKLDYLSCKGAPKYLRRDSTFRELFPMISLL